MKVSLVIPIYNEASHLQSFLRQIDQLNFTIEKELIFVDDCSKDGSREILSDFKFQSPHLIIQHSQNQGKGSAIRSGFNQATGDIIGVQDADFEYSFDEIETLIAPILNGKADIVFGSRFKKNSPQVHRTFHYAVNRILTMLSNLLSGLYLTDMETCYKFFKSDIIKNINLESNRFGFEPEVTAKIARLKIRMMELPISYHPRIYLEGKKITWKDGVAAIRHLVFFNLIQNQRKFFKNTLPPKYLPYGNQWL